GREIIRLREVLVDVVELPLRLIDVEAFAVRLPWREGQRGCKPAVLVDASVDAHLKDLDLAPVGGLRVGEGVSHADAVDGLLRHAVEHVRALTPATSS